MSEQDVRRECHVKIWADDADRRSQDAFAKALKNAQAALLKRLIGKVEERVRKWHELTGVGLLNYNSRWAEANDILDILKAEGEKIVD